MAKVLIIGNTARYDGDIFTIEVVGEEISIEYLTNVIENQGAAIRGATLITQQMVALTKVNSEEYTRG